MTERTQLTANSTGPDTDSAERRWRRWRWVSNWVLGLVCVLGLLFGLGTWLLHVQVLPRIHEFKPDLEKQVSQTLGVPVRVGDLSVQSGGWMPAIELRRVELLDAQGATALMLDKVVLAISARSLWWKGFEHIDIEAPTLDVRRTKSGQWLVAGLSLGQGEQGRHEGADWFFSQPVFTLRRGVIRWTDELNDMPLVSLDNVELTIHNPGRHHRIRLQASPPAAWGDRLQVLADMHHGWLQKHEGDWTQWSGQAFLDLPRTDVAELRRHLSRLMSDVHLQTGRGALRAWAEIHEGALESLTADLALQEVRVQWDKSGKGLEPLELASLSGRMGMVDTRRETGFFTEGVKFTTADGKHWPGGNVRLSHQKKWLGTQERGELVADRLDIGALAQLANRLPLADGVHLWLKHLAPAGLIDEIRGEWSGGWDDPQHWKLKGKVSGIELLAEVPPAQASAPAAPGRPGFKGLRAEFDFGATGGSAQLRMSGGALVFPGVFEQAEIPANEFVAQARWSIKGPWPTADLDVSLDKLRFANPDVQAEGRIHWKTGPQGDLHRWPGHLDLDLALTRADATRVHRYLPLTIPKPAREYVREAIVQGRSDDVRARVKGNLWHFPFSGGEGEFQIRAKVRDVHYAYVPPRLNSSGRWPALTQLHGELIFERSSMEVRGAQARIAESRGLQATQVQARIADLSLPKVQVQGDIKGPLADMLDVVKHSQVNQWIGGALSTANGQGDASMRLKLELPLDKLETAKVEGAVTLGGNDLRITQDSPALLKTKGVVQFTEKSFRVESAQARFLGGDLKFQGGTQGTGADTQVVLQGQGVATATGLREATELGFPAWLARNATGSTGYTARFAVRKGRPEILVQSSLQGLATGLPAPFAKAADTVLPLRYEQALAPAVGQTALQDVVRVDVGKLLNVDIHRDVSGAEPKVLRGTLGVGQLAAGELPLPDKGIAASLLTDALDWDAWEKFLQPPESRMASGAPAPVSTYLPNFLALRVGNLQVGGRTFRNVVMGGGQEAGFWRGNLDAEELSGYVEYRQGQGAAAGQVHARLARLSLAASAASELAQTLDEQPVTVPGMDIVVNDFEYKGRKLGRLEISAANQGRGGAREWRLNKLNLTMPEATLQASGNWVRMGEQAPGAQASVRNTRAPRRTALKFKLELEDSGALLQRLGMGELVRKAPGVMEGQLAWLGSPMALDYGSLSGQFNVDIREGQFLKVDPGAARLLGVLSLQSLPRRLVLDFRDVFSEGFAFDNVRGDVSIENGIAKTNNLQMKGVIAGVLMEGSANIARETQDIHVVVVPEINAGTASLFAAALNPVVGLGTFLAQTVLRKPLIKQNTQEFRVEGAWSDPKITKLDKADEPVAAPATPASGAVKP